MIRGGFRPWGTLRWIINRLPQKHWSLVGCIATGHRSLAVWKELSRGGIDQTWMYRVADIPSAYWADEPARIVQERTEEFIASGGSENDIIESDIRDSLDEINQYIDVLIRRSSRHIIIDISTLPKRFFFPVVRRFLQEVKHDTILATYTRPRYYDQHQPLAIDPGPWRSLPGFQGGYPEPQERTLMIGLGFEPLGLPQIIKEGEFPPEKVKMLFPFPSTPAGLARNWEFVRNLESEVGSLAKEPLRINGYDVSGIFDTILSETDGGQEYCVFAPYGTKPMSLAMCLIASYNASNSSVFYTQPKSYNPRYSTGIRYTNGNPEIYAYCLRLGGRNLYSINQ